MAHPLADAKMKLKAKFATSHPTKLYNDSGETPSPGAKAASLEALSMAANSAKYMAAEVVFNACGKVASAHLVLGHTAEYDVDRWFSECPVPSIAPVSREMNLNYIS